MQNVRKTGQQPPVAAILRALGLLLVMGALALVGGCGDQDDTETPARKRSLLPVAQDSIVVDSLAVRSDARPAPGTLGGSAVSSSLAAAKPSLQAVAATGKAAAEPVAKNSIRRPRVPSVDGAFSLQLGSFRNANNARIQAERINALGYVPVIEVASLAGQTYHRVVLQDLPDREEAERLGERIRSQLGITYLIRRK